MKQKVFLVSGAADIKHKVGVDFIFRGAGGRAEALKAAAILHKSLLRCSKVFLVSGAADIKHRVGGDLTSKGGGRGQSAQSILLLHVGCCSNAGLQQGVPSPCLSF